MDRKAVKTKLISMLLAAVILLVNFNFLPYKASSANHPMKAV